MSFLSPLIELQIFCLKKTDFFGVLQFMDLKMPEAGGIVDLYRLGLNFRKLYTYTERVSGFLSPIPCKN